MPSLVVPLTVGARRASGAAGAALAGGAAFFAGAAAFFAGAWPAVDALLIGACATGEAGEAGETCLAAFFGGTAFFAVSAIFAAAGFAAAAFLASDEATLPVAFTALADTFFAGVVCFADFCTAIVGLPPE